MSAQRYSILQMMLTGVTLAGVLITAVFFIAPLKTLPGEIQSVKSDLAEVSTIQRVQTQALTLLAEIASDTKTMRRDVDRNRADIDVLKERIALLHD